MRLTSTAFADGAEVPSRYTGDGEDLSPPLAWAQVPANAVELVLLVEDPDAPTADPWVHWLVYGISPSTDGLPEGWPASHGSGEVRQGTNSWSTLGYRGPKPPRGHGVHHYRFRLFALDTQLDLPEGARRQQFFDAIVGHVLTEAQVIGLYER